MKRTFLPLLAVALFFSLTSEQCDKAKSADGSSTTSAPAASFFGTRWNLASIAGDPIRVPEGVETPYLSVADDKRMSGFGGCTQLMGSVKTEGSAIAFPNVGSTKMYCEQTQQLENSFLTVLRTANA